MVKQYSFNPIKYTFKWTDDNWYEWDYKSAHRQALNARNKKAKALENQGYKVSRWYSPCQRVKQGGLGTGKPEIELIVNVYHVDIIGRKYIYE